MKCLVTMVFHCNVLGTCGFLFICKWYTLQVIIQKGVALNMTWTNIRIIYSYHPLSFWIWLYTLKSILARNQIKSRMKHGWKKHTTKDRNEVWWDFLANVMLMTKVCVNIFQIKQVIAKNILVLIHVNISCVILMNHGI